MYTIPTRMKSFALHIQQSSEIVFLTLFTHFNNSHHNPCSTPTTTYCTCPLQVVCPTSSTSSTDSTSLTGSMDSTARQAALLLLSQPSASLSTHLARSTRSQKEPEGAKRSQKEPEGARRSQKEPEGTRTAQPLQSLFPPSPVTLADRHSGWPSLWLIATLAGRHTGWMLAGCWLDAGCSSL